MDYSHTSSDDRLLATLAYVLALFFPFVAPLVIFVVKRQSRFVAFHALQALFIELGIVVVGFAVTVIATILGFFGPLALLSIPFVFLAWAVGVAGWVYKIVAAIRSNSGEWYRVPFVAPYAERMA
ncbi:MAG: DUF4870 domain-containing protein [Actinomycetota bacterium]